MQIVFHRSLCVSLYIYVYIYISISIHRHRIYTIYLDTLTNMGHRFGHQLGLDERPGRKWTVSKQLFRLAAMLCFRNPQIRKFNILRIYHSKILNKYRHIHFPLQHFIFFRFTKNNLFQNDFMFLVILKVFLHNIREPKSHIWQQSDSPPPNCHKLATT